MKTIYLWQVEDEIEGEIKGKKKKWKREKISQYTFMTVISKLLVEKE